MGRAIVQIMLLGPVEVRLGGNPVPLQSSMQRTLLASLALTVGRAVPVDRLVDDLWPDDLPDNAMNALRYHVWRVRHLLEPDRTRRSEGSYLLTHGSGYVLDAATVGTDVETLEQSVAAGRSSITTDPSEAAASFRAGLDLFRGEPLGDVDRPFALAERTRLEALHLDATEGSVAAEIESGRAEHVLPDLEHLVTTYPFSEHLRGHLMRALYLCGRQVDALRVYQDTRRILGDELGIAPSPELQAIEAQVLRHDDRLRVSDPVPRRLLPAITSTIVGREHATAELLELLDHGRALTIVGPPGVGKTRLALEAAHRIDDDRDVLFVDVAGVNADDEVGASIAAQLGLAHAAPEHTRTTDPGAGPTAAVIAYLEPRRAMLIIDNCETRLRACARLVTTVLEACPRVSAVATSRQTLGVAGERVIVLGPLDTAGPPAHDAAHPGDVPDSDAAQLFIERARAAGARWAWTPDQAQAVADLCARLDGLPLALELAARRARSMSPSQLSKALDERFRLLTTRGADEGPPSLLAVLHESRHRLSDSERLAFDALSVFAGSFDARAAEAVLDAVTGGDDLAADLLDRLVDHSLVDTVGRSADRYRMLNSIRLFAADRLKEGTSETAAFEAHRNHVLTIARESWASHRVGDGISAAIAELRAERLEILAATDRLLGDELHCAAEQIAAAAGWHWLLDGHVDDARLICARVGPGSCTDPHVASRLALTQSFLAYWQGDHGVDHRDENRAYQLATQTEDWALAAEALSIGVAWDYRPGWFDDDRWAVASSLFERVGDRLGSARTTMKRGAYAIWEGRHAEAQSLLADAMDTFESEGETAGFVEAATYRAWVARLVGDLGRARELLDRCLSLEAEVPKFVQIVVLREQAATAHFEGNTAVAIQTQRRVVRDLERTAPGTPAVTAARAMLSRLCREHGLLDAAETELVACCATLRRSAGEGHELLAPWLLELSAALLARRGDAERAAALLAAADRTRADDGNPRPHWDAREYEGTRRLIAERLTPRDMGVAESQGGALGIDDALRAAIDAMTRSAGTSPATLVHR